MMAGHGLYQKKVDAFDSASLALKSLEPLHLLFAAGADEKTILQQVTHLNQILLEQKILNPFEDPKGVLKETLQEKIKNLTSAENNQLSKILKTQKQKILSDWYKKNRNYFSELSSVEKQKIDKKLEQTLNRVLKAGFQFIIPFIERPRYILWTVNIESHGLAMRLHVKL
jgi:flagellar biosynthesis component FlhA